MGYWDATDLILQENGGQGPPCPACGKPMYPIDDHGRFLCGCPNVLDLILGHRLATPKIIQANTAGMTNEQKAEIPPVNRLDSEPTEAEKKVLAFLLRGPDAMDGPEYARACEELDKERQKKS